ncbi:MAG: peptide ABC transporter substrate-binding protein [Nitrospira sp.]|nr:peptide ABC transporter substrate-binding protein [Nitrospira sp.]
MLVKRILILLPVLIFVLLLQSFFWVPTYDEQAKGNPERLEEFIAASIGDARILNPILHADASSGTIVDKVFEGLIDRDEELRFRGRLAESWDIYEEAYFYVNDVMGPVAGQIEKLIMDAKGQSSYNGSSLGESLQNIKAIEVLPAETQAEELQVSGPAVEDLKPEQITLNISIRSPERIKLTLGRVDQELFENLEELLGKEYFSSFPAEKYIDIVQSGHSGRMAELAQKYLPSVEHNPVIIFNLRKGVKFHDGEEFDSGDVRFTFESVMDVANLSPRMSDFEPVKRLEEAGRYKVRVIYKRLYSPAFGTWGMGILPEHLLNKEALEKEAMAKGEEPGKFGLRDSDFNRKPVGTGPFAFREWKSDQYIMLDRHDDYWEGAANYKNYTYRVVPDLLTQEMEFYGGAIDSYGVQPHQVERLGNDDAYQSFSGLSFGYTYIGYNMRREMFSDKRVRKALGMAIDVDKIIKYVMYNEAERITGPFVKQTDYYDASIVPLPYDPEGALKLLAEAGWKRNGDGRLEKEGKPFAFTLITNGGNDLRKSILAIAQDAWKKIGIDVKTDIVEWTVFLGKHVNTGNFDALILGWSMGIDPDLYQIWHSSQTNPQQLNFVGFENAEADDLIVKIRQEYDYDRQVQYCNKLHNIIADEQPYTFLYVGKWTAVLDKKIVILDRMPSGEEKIAKIEPTRTGNYSFYFNKWVKLSDNPVFDMEQ